jgi:nucleoside-diphosphate-sugar epimerase
MAGFTVIGGAGFIGSRLVSRLESEGHSCHVPARGEEHGESLGHVVWCAGLTGDWAERPYDAVDAHVGALNELVRTSEFESLLYLSSTRVYDRHAGALAREDDALVVKPQEGEDLYALSKMAGEAVALRAGGRVARLSNVYGAEGFVALMTRQAVETGRVVLESALESTRDFVGVADVVALLPRIALEGRERVYNVASGVGVTNRELTDALARLTGCEVLVRPGAPVVARPAVDIARAAAEFGFAPAHLLDELPAMLETVPS